jgi:hypothetical protein
MKEKMGISIDRDVVENLNNVVEAITDLKISKSELIETILVTYFKAEANPSGKARELTIEGQSTPNPY